MSAVKRIVAEVNPDLALDFQVFKIQVRDSLLGASAMLFGLKQNDPATIAMAIAALAAVALATSYLPTQRAASLEPMMALREDNVGLRPALPLSTRNCNHDR